MISLWRNLTEFQNYSKGDESEEVVYRVLEKYALEKKERMVVFHGAEIEEEHLENILKSRNILTSLVFKVDKEKLLLKVKLRAGQKKFTQTRRI